MFRLFGKVLLPLGLVCVVSCGGSSQNSRQVTDSIADSAVVSQVAEIKMLPDTAYPSATKVKFDIQIPDEDAEKITTVGAAIEYVEAHTK